MKIIGLTGGIGSGKSTVAGFMAELGAAVIELDKVGHEVLKSGGPAYKKAVSEFGKDILDSGGEIDRAKLGRLVFNSPEALARLNRITHPAIDKILKERLEGLRRRGVKVVVLEAAAILEAGKGSQAEELWVTTAPEKTVLKRLRERSGYSAAESRARLRSQMPDAERLRHADVVIDTGGRLDEVKGRVREEWGRLMGRAGIK